MRNTMNAIIWPAGFEPGYTENFASNEIILAGLSAADIWPLLAGLLCQLRQRPFL